MKGTQGLIITILFFLALSACNKEDSTPGIAQKLQGKWRLVEVTGGFSGEGYTPAFDVLLFRENRYRLELEEALVSGGNYEFDREKEHGLQFGPDIAGSAAVAFEQEDKSVQFDESGDLFLSDPCCDLFVYQFIRVI